MKRIEIYGQKGCSACVQALDFVRSHALPAHYHDIADETSRREMFQRNPAAKTVPQIFIGDRLIGGRDQLVATPVLQLQQMIGGQ